MITLKTVPFHIENPEFFIEEVIDNRAEKHLGLLKNGDGEKVEFRLFPNTVEALEAFIKTSIPKTSAKKGIVMEVKALNIQESRINETEVIARAFVHLVFYEKNRNKLKELYQIEHKEDQIFENPILVLSRSKERFVTHEKRIRAALEYCLLAFSENQSAQKASFLRHFDTVGIEKEKTSKLDKWYNIITYRQLLTSTYHEGWAVGYTGFLDSDKSFIIPYELSFEQYRVKENLAQEEGFEYVDSYALRPGLYGYKKLTSGVYIALGVDVPIGLEVVKPLDSDETYKFLVGISASQGIKIIPWKNYGIVFGVEFFQQIQNSEIFTRDIGLELTLGVNF